MTSIHAKLALPAMILLAIATTPAAAVEQNCRFVQAKAEREACYKRQEEALAARRKPAPPTDTATMDALRENRQDDEAMYRSINNICRGC